VSGNLGFRALRRQAPSGAPPGSLNKVQLVGEVLRECERRPRPGGAALRIISLATPPAHDLEQHVEMTDWHQVVLSEGLAKSVGNDLRTGCTVFIEGRLRTHRWRDSENREQYSTEIVASAVQILPQAIAETKAAKAASHCPHRSGPGTATTPAEA